MRKPRFITAAAICLIVLSVPAMAVEPGPQGVSPGAPDRIARVNAACPTFSWEATPGAVRYELVVHRYDEATRASSSGELPPDTEVLFSTVSGRATSWTPEASDCFAPGGAYVWFVRAATDADAGDGGEWSEPRFFEIDASPSPEQVQQALDVLEHYLETGGDDIELEALATRDRHPSTGASSRGGASTTKAGASGSRSVITGTAAIRGEQPDPSGETYGVVGVSSSPDGAGIGAANTAGGPDLVLDGSEDGETNLSVSQSGVQRDSTQIESFDFSNPGTGEIDIHVEGWIHSHEFVGGGSRLTAVDADTLDGIDGAAFATDAEAAGLVAAHAASADHDGRYYTETELNTSGTADAVHWNNLGGVPPGFADGIDNDTSYTMGPGLIIDNGEIQIDPAAFSVRIYTWASTGVLGQHSSVAIGDDGLGLISFYYPAGGNLLVLHCNDVLCTSPSLWGPDSTDDVGRDTSVAIGTDGYPLISYYDATNGNLKVAHCNTPTCSSSSVYTLDSGGDVGRDTSVTIGADGLGLISYRDVTDIFNHHLKVAHCNNTACSSASISTLDSSTNVRGQTSVAIGNDNLGLISYFDSDNQDLRVAHCNNTACSSASFFTLDAMGEVGLYNSIAIGSDGRGLISYMDTGNRNLKVAHCNGTSCSSASISTLDSSGGWFDAHTSVAIGADGLGFISYHSNADDDLKVAHCHDIKCTSATIHTVDSAGNVGRHNSVAIGIDGLPLISYYDLTNGDLKVAHLPFWY